MDGCTELVRRKWGREALKPGGSPGANLLVQGRPPMLMWDWEAASLWAALEAAAQAEAHIPGV